MYIGMLHTHKLVVSLFLIIYLIKTALLVLNKHESLDSFIKRTKVAEIIISTLFLLTGIYLAMNSANNGTWLWMKLFVIACSIPLAIIGFKKKNQSLALVSLMFLIYAYGISETKSPFMSDEKKKVDTANVPVAEVGKKIYEEKCILCHGSDGKLGLSGAKDLTQSTLTHDEKVALVMNGKNAMMSFKEQLTPEQVEAVVLYVEALH
jgi:mono/diheme cytochrome c family protein